MSILDVHVEDTTVARFLAKIDKSGECWLWTGFTDKAGYARLHGHGKHAPVLYAHRLSYERYVGPVPEGLELDHLCRVRHCVNPLHLEAVTRRENFLRGESRGARAIRTGRCQEGHAYDRRTKQGWQWCSQCANAGARRRYAVKRQAMAA